MDSKEIIALHKKSGLSNNEFAKAIGVSVNSIINWETGQTLPTDSSINKIRVAEARFNSVPKTPTATSVPRSKRIYSVMVTDQETGQQIFSVSINDRKTIVDLIDHLIP